MIRCLAIDDEPLALKQLVAYIQKVPFLELAAQETDESVSWACLPAEDDHLEGLWSLPQMIGEVKENILYGGGLAPAKPKYGPRPIIYKLYARSHSRSALNFSLRKLLGFLASGRIEADNNGYGFTREGFLAAPPVVEWQGNRRYCIRISLTITFLDPAIYGSKGAELEDYLAWAKRTSGFKTRNLEYTGLVEWTRPDPINKPRAVLRLTNTGSMTVYPWFFVEFNEEPTWPDRSGFQVRKEYEWEKTTADEALVLEDLGGTAMWYADEIIHTGGRIAWTPTTGTAYAEGGQVVRPWPYTPIIGRSQTLSLAPGETARYLIGGCGDGTNSYPFTQRTSRASALAIYAEF